MRPARSCTASFRATGLLERDRCASARQNPPQAPLLPPLPRPTPPMPPVDDPAVTVRQAVLADLDALATLFDAYRRFQGRPADPSAARDFLRARFDHGESIVF